jgi:hypothetical protein
MVENWSFDVIGSTHDLVKQGIIDAGRIRVVISGQEFPEFWDAHLVAAQIGTCHFPMVTSVLYRY